MSSVYRKCLMMSDLQSGAEEIEYVLRKDYDALRSQLAEWELAAQQGHPSPCTLGPLCPYCEIENLHAGRALIVARAENAERALVENEARLAEAERLLLEAVDIVESCHDCIRMNAPALHARINTYLSRKEGEPFK